MDVVLGAPARECRQSWVVGDDPGTLAVALLWGIDRTAAVLTEIQRDDQGVTASQNFLPAWEVERRWIAAGGRRVFGDDDVSGVCCGGIKGSSECGKRGATAFPWRAIRAADRVEKRACASIVELLVTERATGELDKPVCRAGSACGTRLGQECLLNLWAKDVMSWRGPLRLSGSANSSIGWSASAPVSSQLWVTRPVPAKISMHLASRPARSSRVRGAQDDLAGRASQALNPHGPTCLRCAT